MSRTARTIVARTAVLLLVCGSGEDVAQAQTSRTEAIDQERRDKQARLWPERESPLVRQANDVVERGFKEGVEDGLGASGPQMVLGGMRSGHGMSFGGGWRQTDVWNERLGLRGTGRMTFQGAYMLDGRLDFNSLTSERAFANVYTKWERSPKMDFYGLGPGSAKDERSSYLLQDWAIDFQAGIGLLDNHLRIGGTGGAVLVETGAGRRSGVPSTPDAFPGESPGIGEGDIDFDRWGGFIVFDHRDTVSGTRSGGVYGVRFREYFDRTLNTYDFRQAEFEFQQFIPYFNRTRVIALRAATTLSFHEDDKAVPVFFMPTVGGNEDLRGFARYRYHDNHMIFVSAEHRWYIFRGLDMALFADAGKVIPRKADLDFSELEYSGGIGFRTRLRDMVIMRTDLAYGRDGFRLIWTFDDIFSIDY